MDKTIAKVSINGCHYKAQVIERDTETYIETMLVLRVGNQVDFMGKESRGSFTGAKTIVFENGDGFVEWLA